MKRIKLVKKLRKFHKWPGIIIAFFVIQFALSGIIMNHRGIVSSIDVNRKLLPSNYSYNNWNQAGVRGSLIINGDTGLIYGNIGIWKTIDDFNSFSDYNDGFPKGIDGRKIYSAVNFKGKQIIAGTQFGLYNRNFINDNWVEIDIPVNKKRIADLTIKNDTLIVLTRNYLLKTTDLENFEKIQLPQTVNYERKAGLFNTLWELHSGELFGLIGKLAVDLFGIVIILLSVTGILHFIFPKIIRSRKRKDKTITKLNLTKRKNLRWHNVVGYIFVLFLVINTITGMHLRPPLLIPIANSKVGIIPFTHLDTPNPWHDKLRRVKWDDDIKKYIFSTSEGLFSCNENFTNKLQPLSGQPPVSIMGCNVFEKISPGKYLVGSFSGMFIWDIYNHYSTDYFTGHLYSQRQGMSRPIANNMVAGWVQPNSNQPVWFDYNRGALPASNTRNQIPESHFPKMSEEILEKSPMSLWNVSLEVHTGRIFESIFGLFYILYVPLAGICILIVLISGFFIWWFAYRKKRVKMIETDK